MAAAIFSEGGYETERQRAWLEKNAGFDEEHAARGDSVAAVARVDDRDGSEIEIVEDVA
ncbi:hypothetical protein [Mesorhizobium temperatum]|uniref:hypothetical protein n=1 Tax=Mesorhizobium temperatum TaxID=241416 RepID=UPI00142DDD9F|nr:hypothetical protein [Mesorhizobium temperatum]